MSVGENIKEIRQGASLTQLQLAEIVGVTQPTIAQIERGTKSPTIQLSSLIAQALNCDIKEFLKK